LSSASTAAASIFFCSTLYSSTHTAMGGGSVQAAQPSGGQHGGVLIQRRVGCVQGGAPRATQLPRRSCLLGQMSTCVIKPN
jgi:hypothetical protein